VKDDPSWPPLTPPSSHLYSIVKMTPPISSFLVYDKRETTAGIVPTPPLCRRSAPDSPLPPQALGKVRCPESQNLFGSLQSPVDAGLDLSLS